MQLRLSLTLNGNPFLICWFLIWQTCNVFSCNSCELRISHCIKLSKIMELHPYGFWKGVEKVKKSSLQSRLWWRQRISFVLNKWYFFPQQKHMVWFRKASFWIFSFYNSNMFISMLGLCLLKCEKGCDSFIYNSNPFESWKAKLCARYMVCIILASKPLSFWSLGFTKAYVWDWVLHDHAKTTLYG